MKKETDFGQFITEQRIRKSMKCGDLAEKIGISNAYLSQLEHGVRENPDPMLILKIVKALDMDPDDAERLYDMFAQNTNCLPPDITEYLLRNRKAQLAIRMAFNMNVAESVWEHFIDELKK